MQNKIKNVLINSKSNDLHSDVVTKVLAEMDCRVTLYQSEKLAINSAVNFSLNGQKNHLEYHWADQLSDLSEIEAVWHRRPQTPMVPGYIVPEDKMFVQQELCSSNQACLALLEHAFWLNPQAAAARANIKPLQLSLADKVGLAIPETLISNDPKGIKAFINSGQDAIYKPLNALVWHEQGRNYATYNARVTTEHLPNDTLLSASPGIYQRLVAKQYEVRAQFFGRSCFAVSIDSNRLQYGELDWRLHQHQGTLSSPVELPDEIYQAACALMDELGLVCGAFDFIVTRDDEWVFLEVNESGQFLFLEQWCPELPVLDAFCKCLVSQDKDFAYKRVFQPRKLADVLDDYQFDLALYPA
ncbi:MvdC/MvdD family ATP grasp protein [Thalassomonas haliotis]|uniref:MvdD-like pre-ATP grasp domain-containing protein n=1 Tax=Thalassomonas haliotis TaxID=485448 RepID=A0ABY7VH96_9GAMM|nr:hypothetical protein [Thalassomonas haliotis]WDE12042.1 hypothetical protein H3N35_00680 [Thalassomonas haliotis]